MNGAASRMVGLTLIELLVAMALFAVIGSLSYRALVGVRHTAERTADASARWQAIARSFERLGRDLRQPLSLASRDGARWRPAWLGNPAEMPDGIEFTRLGGDRREAQRIAYRWRDGELQLLQWPAGDIDGHAPAIYSLLGDVRQARFDFLDALGQWRPDWGLDTATATARPRAVRLAIDLGDGIALERIFDLP